MLYMQLIFVWVGCIRTRPSTVSYSRSRSRRDLRPHRSTKSHLSKASPTVAQPLVRSSPCRGPAPIAQRSSRSDSLSFIPYVQVTDTNLSPHLELSGDIPPIHCISLLSRRILSRKYVIGKSSIRNDAREYISPTGTGYGAGCDDDAQPNGGRHARKADPELGEAPPPIPRSRSRRGPAGRAPTNSAARHGR